MASNKKIAFQGFAGAYSDMACRAVYPDMETLPCESFEDAFAAVKGGQAALAMIPVDNTLAGRVADVHHLIPKGGLHIIGEHFQPIQHALLGVKGAAIGDIAHVHSHIHAIPQCQKLIKKLGVRSHIHADTAGAAAEIARRGEKEHAAIASPLAATLYGLDILQKDVQDADHNTTRFLILSAQEKYHLIRQTRGPSQALSSASGTYRRRYTRLLAGLLQTGFQLQSWKVMLVRALTSRSFFVMWKAIVRTRPLCWLLKSYAFLPPKSDFWAPIRPIRSGNSNKQP